MANECLELSPEFLRVLDPIKSTRVYTKGALLFECGRPAEGLYLIVTGEVKMLNPAGIEAESQTLVVGSGAVLALSESLAGANYKLTAEAADQTTVAFIERQQFMEFLREHCDVCMQIVRLLSEDLHNLYYKFGSIEVASARSRERTLPSVPPRSGHKG